MDAMALERTLAIIKPDAVEKGIIGEICKRIEDDNLKIVGMKFLQLDKKGAEGFYAVHKDKQFFDSLVKFMSSGPSVVMVLEGEDAINRWRETMGVTDPEKAAEGSLRRDFGTDIQHNAVHGSDSTDTADFEVSFFFKPKEIVKYEWV
jgi:nucleoside-diphosphate kinase